MNTIPTLSLTQIVDYPRPVKAHSLRLKKESFSGRSITITRPIFYRSATALLKALAVYRKDNAVIEISIDGSQFTRAR